MLLQCNYCGEHYSEHDLKKHKCDVDALDWGKLYNLEREKSSALTAKLAAAAEILEGMRCACITPSSRLDATCPRCKALAKIRGENEKNLQ